MGALRSSLDWLYRISGVMAALCLIGILGMIVAQMIARWIGDIFPGAPQYAGYLMAAASFLAFANALNGGAHIRVSILLNAVPAKIKWVLEVWCFGIATAVTAYFVYYAYWFVYWSWRFNEVSQAQDASPLWIPQSVMVVGGVILLIAFVDNLISVLFKGDHRLGSNVVDQSFGE
ncbi:TRAP transporter small permease [Gymnodinialimonas hymeniacidonis]|uniref:TRAP transporter small permease n=1 Tax=Gymnodinialimonas hymeniacidonis TaxID=3126508 RepID=UPI0034C6776F